MRWPSCTTWMLVALVLPSDALAYCRTTSPLTPAGACETGTPVSWAVGCLAIHVNARGLTVDADAGQDLDVLVRTSVARSVLAWGEARCTAAATPALRMVVVEDVDADLDAAMDGRNVVSVNRRWAPDAFHRPGTIAFTVVSSDAASGSILEADVELNARAIDNPLGRIFDDGPSRWGVVDAPTVMLHELGHVAGLWHSLEPGAVMEASMDVERQRRALTEDDRRGVCAVYHASAGTAGTRADCTPEPPHRRPPSAGGCSVVRGVAPKAGPGLLSLMACLFAAGWRRVPLTRTARSEPSGQRPRL